MGCSVGTKNTTVFVCSFILQSFLVAARLRCLAEKARKLRKNQGIFWEFSRISFDKKKGMGYNNNTKSGVSGH